MISDAELVSMGLWVIYVYSSEKCQLTSFIYLNKVVLLLLMFFIYGLDINPLSGRWFANIFLYSTDSADCVSLHILRFSTLT